MKKIFAIMLIAANLAVMLTGCAGSVKPTDATEDEPARTTDAAVSERRTIDLNNLPSKFDLRNVDGKNYVTPVKAQRWGDCWSFALAGAAETAYLYANDLGVPAGEKNDKVNFSEKYIAWYMFHGMTKDDVVTGRVRASQVGEGFDPSEAEEASEMTPYFIGGPFVQTANLFGCGFGPVDESVVVNGELSYAYDAEASFEWELPLNAAYRSTPVAALFRDSRVLPTPAKTDADGNYVFNREGVDAIKKELCQGHGVCVALNAQNPGYNGKKRASYYSGDEEPNHAVLVVGYDDDFPKEKFTRTESDGTEVEGSTPPENGALIIKNSWGLTSFDGDIDDGYVYVSYYDHCLLVTYEIYKDVEKDSPSSGTLLEKAVNTHPYAGSHVIDLQNEYPLKKGESYAVVLTVKHGSQYAEVFPYSLKFFDGMTVKGVINKGESFLYTDGKWTDMAEQKDSLLERAYELQSAESIASDKAVPDIEIDKKTFAVDNYPIKAISAPSGK